jgi:hypothetical protein
MRKAVCTYGRLKNARSWLFRIFTADTLSIALVTCPVFLVAIILFLTCFSAMRAVVDYAASW